MDAENVPTWPASHQEEHPAEVQAGEAGERGQAGQLSPGCPRHGRRPPGTFISGGDTWPGEDKTALQTEPPARQ